MPTEQAGLGRDSQRRAGVTLGVALQHAVRLRLVPYNVARDVPKPRVEPKKIHALTTDDSSRLLAAAPSDRLYALYAVWICSGAHESELFALTWADVDFEAGAVTITKNLEEISGRFTVRDVKTSKSRRRVQLSDFSIEALAAHCEAMLAEGSNAPDRPIFCEHHGGFLRKSNVLRRSFRPILERAGLPTMIRPYDLRTAEPRCCCWRVRMRSWCPNASGTVQRD